MKKAMRREPFRICREPPACVLFYQQALLCRIGRDGALFRR